MQSTIKWITEIIYLPTLPHRHQPELQHHLLRLRSFSVKAQGDCGSNKHTQPKVLTWDPWLKYIQLNHFRLAYKDHWYPEKEHALSYGSVHYPGPSYPWYKHAQCRTIDGTDQQLLPLPPFWRPPNYQKERPWCLHTVLLASLEQGKSSRARCWAHKRGQILRTIASKDLKYP